MSTRLTPEEREQQIIENINLVYYMIQQLPHINPNNYDDLVQLGRIGLIKAVSTFDPDKGIQFSTYASRCIMNEIYMDFRKEKQNNRNISLNDIIYTNEKGNELELGDTLATEEDLTDKEVNNEVIINALNIILNLLKPKEGIFILYRISGFYTQEEIGKILGVSQSYSSRINKRAVRNLRQYLDREVKLYCPAFSIVKVCDSYKFICNTIQSNEALAKFLQDEKTTVSLSYKVTENNGRIELIMPSEPETFVFIAEFLKETYGF